MLFVTEGPCLACQRDPDDAGSCRFRFLVNCNRSQYETVLAWNQRRVFWRRPCIAREAFVRGLRVSTIEGGRKLVTISLARPVRTLGGTETHGDAVYSRFAPLPIAIWLDYRC